MTFGDRARGGGFLAPRDWRLAGCEDAIASQARARKDSGDPGGSGVTRDAFYSGLR